MSKYTPGRWVIDEHLSVQSKDSRTIADVYPHWDDSEANARLISAAPEMIELLKRIAEVFPQSEELFDSVRAVIAKAEGA